ncbi:MAG: EamA family transporter [Planctomycetota bacterium]
MDGRTLALCLLTALCWGASSFLEKTGSMGGAAEGLTRVDRSLAAVAIRNLVIGIGGIAAFFAAGGLSMFSSTPGKAQACFAGAGLVGGILGGVIYFMALQKGSMTQTIAVCAVYPAIATILAVLLHGERPSPRVLAGLFLVVAGVFLLSEPKAEKETEKPAAAEARP